MAKNIIYEQPLNEHIRICLRLEFLFEQIAYHFESENSWNTRHVITAILEVLQVIDRPDLKNKFSQALTQYANSLTQLEKLPNVDHQKLTTTINKIDQLNDILRTNQGKIGQELRDNEFLNMIQQRLYTPAGTCNFNLPVYQLWLAKQASTRKSQLLKWLEQFSQLRECVELILKMTRDSALFKQITATSGFYQANLDPSIPYQLIRLHIPNSATIYPEISIGRHRISTHFLSLNPQGQAQQITENIEFELAFCKI